MSPTRPNSSESARRSLLQKAALILLYALLYLFFSAHGIFCIWHDVFHILCPGCGLTRGCIFALRGDFLTAVHFHPMFWCVPILLLYFFRDGTLFQNKAANRLTLIGIFSGLIGVWIYRLCIGFTFT